MSKYRQTVKRLTKQNLEEAMASSKKPNITFNMSARVLVVINHFFNVEKKQLAFLSLKRGEKVDHQSETAKSEIAMTEKIEMVTKRYASHI